jgi:hypothetical protein
MSAQVDKTKIPLPGTRNAPEFDGTRPQELRRFLRRMEDLFNIYGINGEEDRIQQVVKYTDADTEEEWKAFDSYGGKDWKDFIEEVISNYPEAECAQEGAMFRLNDICSRFRNLGITDRIDILSLKRKFVAESKKLRTPPALISNLELVNKFASCLSADLKAQVFSRLNYHRNSKDTKRRREDLYDIDAVIEMTVRLVNEGDADAFSSLASRHRIKESSAERTTRGGSMVPHTSTKEEIDSLTNQVAELRDEVAISNREYKIFREEMTKTLQQVNRGLQNNQGGWRPPQNQTYNLGSRTNDPKCYYCWKTGHMVNSCPERLRHLEEKKLVIGGDGRVKLPNGQEVPRDGNKSMRDRVEAAHSTSVNYFEDPDEIALTLSPAEIAVASSFMHNVPSVQKVQTTTRNKTEEKNNDLQSLLASQMVSMQKSMTELLGEVKSIGNRQTQLEQRTQRMNMRNESEDRPSSGF